MKKYIITGIIISILMISGAGFCKGNTSGRTAEYLRLGVGAAAAGAGEAYTAREGVIESLYYNPAGMYSLKNKTFQFQHNNYLLDIKSEYIAYAVPKKLYSFGVSLNYYDMGKFTRRTFLNPDGIGNFGAKTYIFSMGASKILRPDIIAGCMLRYFSETIDDAQRTGVALDLGFIKKYTHFDLGIVVKNIGQDIKFYTEEEKLPMEVRIGVSIPELIRNLRVSLEFGKVLTEQNEFRAGIEYTLSNTGLMLRTGYDSRNDLDNGISFGLGYLVNNFSLDYAFIPFSFAGDSHKISITLK